MKVFIKARKNGYDASGEYNTATKELTLLKGSIVCEKVNSSDNFNRNHHIEKLRNEITKNNVVIKDYVFSSASTAANFVTGSSTNGMTRWKTESGKSIKEVL